MVAVSSVEALSAMVIRKVSGTRVRQVPVQPVDRRRKVGLLVVDGYDDIQRQRGRRGTRLPSSDGKAMWVSPGRVYALMTITLRLAAVPRHAFAVR